MAAHSKEDGYYVTSQSGKFTSVSVFCLSPRIDLTLSVSGQRLGDKTKYQSLHLQVKIICLLRPQ